MRLKILIGLLMLIIMATAFMGQVESADEIIDNTRDLFKQIQLFADSITLISSDYVEPVKARDLVYGAIRGMMGTLDGYSQFLDPESFKEITEETKGEFGGLGVEIGIRDGVLTVIAPMEDTPAFAAGIQAGDRIVKINGEITRDMTLDEAVKKMRGKPGTKITITVIRKGVEDLLDFTITRAVIKLKSIKGVRIIEDDIGYVKLAGFQEHTARDLRRAINRLRQKGAGSLILDLRNNPGGLLDAAVEVANQFLEPGAMIVYTEGRDPEKRMEFRAKKQPEFNDMKVVVLVNKGSASASEILAGALKDNKRALVMGVPTFGKGSVQTVIPLRDGSALRLTTAAYFTPSGKNLMDKGIEPNIYVEKRKLAKKQTPGGEPGTKGKRGVKKSEIFKRVTTSKKPPSKCRHIKQGKLRQGRKMEMTELLEYDNQLQAAVNVLKGVQIFQGYKASSPAEKVLGEGLLKTKKTEGNGTVR